MHRDSRVLKLVFSMLMMVILTGLVPAGLLKPLNLPGPSGAAAAGINDIQKSTDKKQEEKSAPDKTVYLTFDDGPSSLTPKVLDILDKHQIKATFFVLGKQALSSPEYIRQIVDGGHTLGNHTYDHDYDKLYPNFSDFWSQIKQTEEILRETTGARTQLVRAPGGTYGHFDKTYFTLLEQAGYKVFDWDIDSGDSVRAHVPAADILKNATDSSGEKSIVLLLHDGPGHGNTVKALPQIIRYYEQQGYKFAALTPDSKPVQFRISSNLRESRKEPSRAWIDSHIVPNKALFGETPPLHVIAGGIQTRLSGGEYELRENAFYVPLRQLVEQLGGTVSWNGKDQSARVNLNGKSLILQAQTGEVRFPTEAEGLRWETGKTTVGATMTMLPPKNDALWVSLRSLLEALDYGVTAVHPAGQGWTVSAA